MSTSTNTDSPRTTPDRGDSLRRSVFVTTHWSVVLTAGRSDTPRARAALERLCCHYWQPLYAYIRRVGHAPEEAQDLTQDFFAQLLEHHLFTKADPSRGRFRSFLLASLKHFLAHEWEKARAQKRGGGVQLLRLDFGTAETWCVTEPANTDTPDKIYDRQWALSLLDVVLARLRADYADCGKDELFLALKETLAGGRSEIPYLELARRLSMSEGAVKTAAHRLRQRYRVLLREEIANTVASTEETEEELRYLFIALGS